MLGAQRRSGPRRDPARHAGPLQEILAGRFQLLMAVAAQAGQAIENARMHETLISQAGLKGRDLDLATQVQKSFLPKTKRCSPQTSA